MSSNITRTNGVRIFTVVVLSGSLFLLIYRIGRRRLEHQAPKLDSARENPLTRKTPKSSDAHLRRYFSHHYDKSYPRVSSFLEAVESSKSNPNTSHEFRGASSRCVALHEESCTASDISDAETDNPYILSSTDAALRYNLENRARKLKSPVVTEAEETFLEHLGQRSSQETPRNFILPTSPGDISSFEPSFKDQKPETRRKDVAGGSTSSGAPGDAFAIPAVEKSRNRGNFRLEDIFTETRREIPSILTYHTTTSFAKPLLYCFMWCILSHSFSLFSRTGIGAKKIDFPVPFFRITVHFIIQSILASCMLRWPIKKVFYTSWTTLIWRVIPVAVAATVDHEPQPNPFSQVCENRKVPDTDLLACQTQTGGHFTNFRKTFVERTLAVLCHAQCKCKAWVPLIAFILATRFKLDGQGHRVFSNVLIISVGFMLTAYKEEEVESWSLTELFSGSVVSAFRLAATQNLLQARPLLPYLILINANQGYNQKVNSFNCFLAYISLYKNREIGLVSPVVTMRALAPAMALVTAIFSYFWDPWSTLIESEFFNSPLLWTNLIVGALLETSVALAELVVIYHTSANTMIIIAMIKEVTLSMIDRFHHDDYTRFNAIGVGVFFVGVFSYALLKYQKIIKHVRFQEDSHGISAAPGQEGSSSAGSFFLTDLFSITRAIIWNRLSSGFDCVLQVNGSLRIMCRAWRDRFCMLRRLRQ